MLLIRFRIQIEQAPALFRCSGWLLAFCIYAFAVHPFAAAAMGAARVELDAVFTKELVAQVQQIIDSAGPRKVHAWEKIKALLLQHNLAYETQCAPKYVCVCISRIALLSGWTQCEYMSMEQPLCALAFHGARQPMWLRLKSHLRLSRRRSSR